MILQMRAKLKFVTCLFAFAVPMLAQNPDVEYYRLVKGSVPENKNAYGLAEGIGFAVPNPWGQYTAYLMAVNAKGQRTFRIEHYLPNPDGQTAQGSTMYLLEGSVRAVLIDTANPATFTLGKNDLKTLVRFLLAHENDGSVRAHPLDFVVANTHSHGDHIGENSLMSDRTVYYMDLDWPEDAPPNYVPIREGGGPTNHGDGHAVAAIDLGSRLISAIAMPPHTPGSTGYLDVENRMLFTGDAIGSSWPWLQWTRISVFAKTMHHLEEVTRPYPDLAVFPAHFYQIAAYERGKPPMNGRPLDRTYILDMEGLVEGVLAGTIVGEPYMAGPETYWARNKSAQMVYSPANVYLPGESGFGYHAVVLPGHFQEEASGAPLPAPLGSLFRLKNEFYLIRDNAGESLFLLRGSTAALLIGTGGGEPGLVELVHRLAGDLPLDVAVLDGDPRQAGGIQQLAIRHLYVPGNNVLNGLPALVLRDGQKIDLGLDAAGKPLMLEASTFVSDGVTNMALLNAGDRVLFAGNAFRKQDEGAPIPMARKATPAQDAAARAAWVAKAAGKLDFVYLAPNTRWYTDPQSLDDGHSPQGR